jgi:glutamate/tyrosine decarboxylase-like PLP-dependent enzyme
LSQQGHSSIHRGLQTLGFASEAIRVLPTDDAFSLRAQTVADAVRADRDRGLEPAIVIASAGTTNTGTVDELERIADLCEAEKLWFHIDGAYGASALLCEAGRRVLRGAERADSLVLDPHKWLFAPYDLGCLFVARPGLLERTFGMNPEYLADVYSPHEVDFGMRGPELTRRARGLKLWLMFRMHGATALSAAVARGIESAEYAARLIDESDFWEIVTPAQLGVVTFARGGASQADHADCVATVAASGFAAVTSTELNGRPTLRLCTINPATTQADIEETLRRLTAAMPAGRAS